MSRIRIGIAGGGLISQIQHIPNVLHLKERFELVGVADPSSRVRATLGRRHQIDVFERIDDLVDAGLDALLVAVPDPAHVDVVLGALEHGLHVFCEKPLCYSASDADRILRARDSSGTVVQVGYMKRYDPHYEAMLELLPDGPEQLHRLEVHMVDCDAPPFLAHQAFTPADDIPPDLRADLTSRRDRAVHEAIGIELEGAALRAYALPLLGGVVHAVNAGHGVLDKINAPAGRLVDGGFWRSGHGVRGVVELLDGQALWEFSQLQVGPGLPLYSDRLTAYFDDFAVELRFASPYLRDNPSQLRLWRGRGLRLDTSIVDAGYEGAFVRELEGFWRSIAEGAPVRNTVEEAKADVHLLNAVARRALAETAVMAEGV